RERRRRLQPAIGRAGGAGDAARLEVVGVESRDLLLRAERAGVQVALAVDDVGAVLEVPPGEVQRAAAVAVDLGPVGAGEAERGAAADAAGGIRPHHAAARDRARVHVDRIGRPAALRVAVARAAEDEVELAAGFAHARLLVVHLAVDADLRDGGVA